MWRNHLYAASQNKHLMQQFADSRGFSVGTLPFRYLGLPLTYRTWAKLYHEPLIDRIHNKFLAWSHRSLSFAGRLQLIKSTIASIINFWRTAFILPISCLDEIERLCSAFLWSGSPNVHLSVKVVWGFENLEKHQWSLLWI